MKRLYRLYPFQYEKICNLNGDHGREHRANEIEKIGYIGKWQEDRTQCTDGGYCNRNQLTIDFS